MERHAFSQVVMKDSQGYLNEKRVDLLLAACETQEEYSLLLIMWKTGGRISEILAIKKQDFDFEEDSIILKTLKKRKPTVRSIPLDKKTIDYFKTYAISLDDGDKLFKINRYQAYRILLRVGKRAKIVTIGTKQLHPHVLRHSFAIHCAKKGLPINVVARLLGHSNLAMTAYYQNFTSEDIKDLVKKIWGEKV